MCWIWFCFCLAPGYGAEEAEGGGEPAAAGKFIDNAETLEAINQVLERVGRIRGIEPKGPIQSSYLDSPTLRKLVEDSIEKVLPEKKRKGLERFLKSLRLIPDDLDLIDMYLSLLDEQVGGLYDPDTKRLFVRETYDIVNSSMARSILAHEICHFLQDQAYGLVAMGIESPDNDDLVTAITTVVEGDAMYLLTEYVALHEVEDILKDLPQALTMDQSALNATPHFFQQQLLFPYIQGQLIVQEGLDRGPEWRERLFTDPPQTSEQILHPEKYFDERDDPAPLALLTTGTVSFLPEGLTKPEPPAGFERLVVNRMGELGTRLVLEERMGAGIAQDAAAGWDGDAYVIYSGKAGDDKWWFCWETAWDSEADAREFLGAWVTYWRSMTGDRKLGSLHETTQVFDVDEWRFRTERAERRVILTWNN